MTSPPAPSPAPPSWPHCGEGADPALDPVGCRGARVTGHTRCLAHLTPTDRTAYLATLSPGADVDHSGTTFTGPVLDELLDALRDPTTTHLTFGRTALVGATFSADAMFAGATFSGAAAFEQATFAGEAVFVGATFFAEVGFEHATFSRDAAFDSATFSANTVFDGATFSADAVFECATFGGESNFDNVTFSAHTSFVSATFSADTRFDSATFDEAWFVGVRFAGRAHFGATSFAEAAFVGTNFATYVWFNDAVFSGDARFGDVVFAGPVLFLDTTFAAYAGFEDTTFSGEAAFDDATFHARARFLRATFAADVGFDGTIFRADARFDNATFSATGKLGPMGCRGTLDLSGAVFTMPVTIEAAAATVTCVRTRWEARATLRLRYADVDLSDAVLTQASAITAHTTPLVDSAADTVETGMTGDPGVRVTSLRGVDAALLVLTNTDLTECGFVGAFHLDQLRLEGETTFARTPPGIDIRRGIPLRWTDRLALAEEHHWRALPVHRPRLRAGWTPDPPPATGPGSVPPGPAALAALYRQLRKAFEDGKDEPGAADFYMGEMEMRRHDRRSRRNRAERGLLTAYWALSGYGLRASRALIWLAVAMTATVFAMMLWGLPTGDPKPHLVGVQAQPGQRVDLVTDNPDPRLSGPLSARITGKRAEKATRVVLNSVVFRSSGQNLTTAGSYIEMTSRFLEPILLGLAALAIRGRVKR